MTDELLARCYMQWLRFGELMLTPDERDQWRDWLGAHWGAYFSAPGRMQTADSIPVHELVSP